MALNGQFVSFKPIVESVYRRAGYQTVDWAEAIEIIGDTIRSIGSLPAYKNITTNGVDTNPNPLEVLNYKVDLPSNLVILEGIRKILLDEDSDGNLSIKSFAPIYEATDLFYKSSRPQWEDAISAGSYDYTEFKQTDTITLSGTSGSATISEAGGLTKTITFSTSLETTAANFVTTNAADYLAQDIVLTSSGDVLTFQSNISGEPFTTPVITNASGDLDGTVNTNLGTEPIIVQGPNYKRSVEYQYQYKIDNGVIITNFEEGFLELSYKGFVTDDHGFPMIPDDQKWRNAIKWSIIEQLDYKKWRVGEISDKVYYNSEQEMLFYIAAARSKADIPSIQKMESLKNMFLRSIIRTDAYESSFKYSNIGEQRYTQNSKYRNY